MDKEMPELNMRIQSHDHVFPPNVEPLYIGGFRDDWDMGVEMHTISGMTGPVGAPERAD